MRLGIFVMYDKHGVVDESIIYLLKEMQSVLTHLVIVCNGFVEQLGIKILEQYSNEIYFRENIGYDASAYMDAFDLYIGWKRVKKYDELVMFNATFFGPFCPMQDIFKQMDERNMDFWGLSRHGSTAHVSTHLQSYFLVVRKSLLASNDFQEFWMTRKRNLTSINDVIDDFEVAFTRFFEEKEYVWTAYADTRDIEDNQCLEKNFDPCVFLGYTAMQRYGLPILKKRLWPWTNTKRGCGNELADAIQYIDKNTDYDIDIIWKTMIRCQDINELRKALHLHFVLPVNEDIKQQEKKHNTRAVVLAWADDIEQIHACKWIPQNCSLILIISDPDLEKDAVDLLKIKEIRLLAEGTLLGVEILKLVIDIKQEYEYVGFFFPKKVYGNLTPERLSFNYNLHANLLASAKYIENICYTFEVNPHLGVMSVPPPYYSGYRREKSEEWGYIFDEVKKIVQLLELRCEFSQRSESQVMEMAFWGRTNVIYELAKKVELLEAHFKKDALMLSVLPRVIPYVAQHLGYYTAMVENADFAGMHIEGLLHITELQSECQEYDINKKNLLQFCWHYKKLYIYGAGKMGKAVQKILLDYNILIEGFVVSDDKWEENQNQQSSIPIYAISHLDKVENIGVVIALNDENKRAIQGGLERYGIRNVFFI